MARVENPCSQVRKGSFREVVFKLRPPDYQQGKRQHEVIQADNVQRPGGAGGVAISHIFLSTVLKDLLQDPLDCFSKKQTPGCCISGLGPGICILSKLLK